MSQRQRFADHLTAPDATAMRRQWRAPVIGIALMAAASLLLPLVDGMAKVLMADHAPILVAWARYAAAALAIAPLILIRGRGLVPARTGLAVNLLRTVLLVASMVCFFLALPSVPLATALGGYFIAPVAAAVLAACLLGERLTARRLAAVALGLAGALFILRPGAESGHGAALALLSGLLFAGYLVATRATAVTMPAIEALVVQSLLGAVLLTPLALLNWSWPDARGLVLMAAMGVLSLFCHLMAIAAFRRAETAVLSPLVYLELVTAVLFGWWFLSERPDAGAVAGIALIVLAGLAALSGRRPQGRIA